MPRTPKPQRYKGDIMIKSHPSAKESLGRTSVALHSYLSGVAEVLVVVAHPDDESFGLGGVLGSLTASGRRVRVLCLTHGEASTVGASDQLGQIRASELTHAASTLKVTTTTLGNWPDGGLGNADAQRLTADIEDQIGDADALIVFESQGVTGHPDHQVATRLATNVAQEHGLLVLEWGVPAPVAAQLREEFSVEVAGLTKEDGTVVTIEVDRAQQWAAIGCHSSQNPSNPFLARRLALMGDYEWLRIQPGDFHKRLARFVSRIGPMAVTGASAAQRGQVLDRLIGFAAAGALPELMLSADPQAQYTVHCVHEDPTGWTLASVVTERTNCTPPHDHESWGAAATVLGVERNLRFHGTCPDALEQIDEQLAPPGGGYLFAAGDIHQACDATGARTVSLHLLIDGGPYAKQHCREPGT